MNTEPLKNFPVGSVGHSLSLMAGVWHDRVEIYSPNGTPLAEDPASGTPGPSPFENLVYISFDGERLVQTNVAYRGRPLASRTFSGRLVDGILRFDKLGPNDPGHIGVSGGSGVLFFVAGELGEGTQRYCEPDCVRLLGPSARTRTTVLYREGRIIRTLTAHGTRLSPQVDRRLWCDPRGVDGPVHDGYHPTAVFNSAPVPQESDAPNNTGGTLY